MNLSPPLQPGAWASSEPATPLPKCTHIPFGIFWTHQWTVLGLSGLPTHPREAQDPTSGAQTTRQHSSQPSQGRRRPAAALKPTGSLGNPFPLPRHQRGQESLPMKADWLRSPLRRETQQLPRTYPSATTPLAQLSHAPHPAGGDYWWSSLATPASPALPRSGAAAGEWLPPSRATTGALLPGLLQVLGGW